MDRWIPYHVTLPRWSRRCYLCIIFTVIFLIVFGPSYFRWMFYHEPEIRESKCDPGSIFLNLRKEADKSNARVDHYPETNERNYALFIGNGHFGVPLNGDFSLYVKSGRTLSLYVPYYPDVKVDIPVQYTEETGVHYTNGIAYIDKCYDNQIRATYTYFAHRTIPSILMQEISIKNSYRDKFVFSLLRKGHSLWDTTVTRVIKLQNVEKNEKEDFIVISGKVLDPYTDKILIVSIVTHKIAHQLEIPAVEIVKLKIFTSIVYTRVTKNQFNSMVPENENRAISYMKLALSKPYFDLKQDHINVWNHLWNTGFSISYSKANGALNGDQINATIYNVLSSVPALFHEETTTADVKSFVTNSLSYVEGCYGSNHHTLEADNLWGNMETVDDINSIVSLWLLTLEKQGCYNLVKAGADGVIQAMVLSFGSFRFSKQHLEFNMHPSFLHRNYHFRRINYGNQTHVNVTVEVDENDKAILYVALDRSDKTYYACDGGCLDSPVQLGQEILQLPVKLTKPFTAILYITSDKQHMEELRHTLHVKEVAEAPAQERNIIIMHKHGHHLGGLPTFFWVSIFTLIVIFHLFLIKLIYNEYWNLDKYKQKQSDDHTRSGVKYRFLH